MIAAMVAVLVTLAFCLALNTRANYRKWCAARQLSPDSRRNVAYATDLRIRTLEADVLTPLAGVIAAAEARAAGQFLASEPKATDPEGRQLQIRAILEHAKPGYDEAGDLMAEYEMIDAGLRARDKAAKRLAAVRAEVTCRCVACGNPDSDVVVIHQPGDVRFLDEAWQWVETTAMGDRRQSFVRGRMNHGG